MRAMTLKLIIGILSGTLLSACETVPETGRSQLVLLSPAQEAQLGFQSFQAIKKETPIARNRSENAMLQKVGQRIAQVAPLPNAKWEFVLFEDDSANAFALPGGKVGIHTGILPITKNEAGLATVIGHEIAHAVARHGAERISNDLAIQLGGTALGAALGGSSGVTRDLAMQAYGVGTKVGVALPYSRAQELEADHLGLLYMARAGYDPREAIAFWERFQEYSRRQGGRPPEFLSTHPLDEKRIARLRSVLPEAMAAYQSARAG